MTGKSTGQSPVVPAVPAVEPLSAVAAVPAVDSLPVPAVAAVAAVEVVMLRAPADGPTLRAGPGPAPADPALWHTHDAADEVGRELDVRAGLGMFATENQLQQLLGIARQRDLAAGQVLFEAGSAVTHLYQLSEGALEMRAPGKPPWRVADTGTIAFVDFMLARPHARRAVAVTAARMLEIDAAAYREYIEDNFEVGHQIIAQFSEALVARMLASPEAAALLGRPQRTARRVVSYAKIEVSLVDRMVLLSRVPAFAGGTVQALANLALSAREVRYAAGELICGAGAPIDELSVLVDGEVELTHPRLDLRITRSPVDLVSHASELTTSTRPLTATAVRDSVVLQVDREELLDRIEEHFELALSMFTYLAGEQEQLNDALARAGEAI